MKKKTVKKNLQKFSTKSYQLSVSSKYTHVTKQKNSSKTKIKINWNNKKSQPASQTLSKFHTLCITLCVCVEKKRIFYKVLTLTNIHIIIILNGGHILFISKEYLNFVVTPFEKKKKKKIKKDVKDCHHFPFLFFDILFYFFIKNHYGMTS